MIIYLCGKCGKVIGQDYIYCPYCGKLIDVNDKSEVMVTVPAGVIAIKIEGSNSKKSKDVDSLYGKGECGYGEVNEVYIDALRYVAEMQDASVSMIQRRFPIGYAKACKIIDWMENMRYITPCDKDGLRKVLITPDEVNEIFG